MAAARVGTRLRACATPLAEPMEVAPDGDSMDARLRACATPLTGTTGVGGIGASASAGVSATDMAVLQEAEEEARRMRRDFEELHQRKRQCVADHIRGCERSLKFLQAEGTVPAATYISLLLQHPHLLPAHVLPPRSPGSQDLLKPHDPLQFGNVVCVGERERQCGITSPWIVNITATCNTGLTQLNEAAMTLVMPHYPGHFNRQSFCTMTLKSASDVQPVPCMTASKMYGTSVVTVTAAHTAPEALRCLHEHVLYLQRFCGLTDARVLNFRVENIVSTADLGFQLGLADMKRGLGTCIRYEPDGFPMAIYLDHTHAGSAKALLFGSGKVVYVGLKSTQQLLDLHCRVSRMASSYRRTAAAAQAEQHQRLSYSVGHVTHAGRLAQMLDQVAEQSGGGGGSGRLGGGTLPPLLTSADASVAPLNAGLAQLTYDQVQQLHDMVDGAMKEIGAPKDTAATAATPMLPALPPLPTKALVNKDRSHACTDAVSVVEE